MEAEHQDIKVLPWDFKAASTTVHNAATWNLQLVHNSLSSQSDLKYVCTTIPLRTEAV
jgi:hypothetical protein